LPEAVICFFSLIVSVGVELVVLWDPWNETGVTGVAPSTGVSNAPLLVEFVREPEEDSVMVGTEVEAGDIGDSPVREL
jgi:hypothetical protein